MTDNKRNVGSGEDKPETEKGGATGLIRRISEMLDPQPAREKDTDRPPPVPPA